MPTLNWPPGASPFALAIAKNSWLARCGLPTHVESRPAPRRRKPSVKTLIKQAEKTGKVVTSVTTSDGVTLRFGESEQDQPTNSWDEVLNRASH